MAQTIEYKLRQLEPTIGAKKANSLRLAYYMEDDFREKRELENHIDLLISQHVTPTLQETITIPPPSASVSNGDIRIGQVEYCGKLLSPVQIPSKDLTRHSGIFGSTGSGKTTVAKNLLMQIHRRGIPFMVIDWEQSWRTLAREIPGLDIYTVGDSINPLHLNILHVPQGVSREEYLKSLINLFAVDYLSGAGSDTQLLTYMREVFNQTENPTFNDLKEHALASMQKEIRSKGKMGGRSGLWKETVGRIINFMSTGGIGEVVGTNKHLPIETLLSKPVVLEFGNIKSHRDRAFLIHVLLNWINYHNAYNGIHTEQLRHVIVMEEFHNLCIKSKEDNMVSAMFRESRKYGQGLIAIDQSPDIPNAIYGNMNLKLSFSLGTHQDITAIGKAMALPPDQNKYLTMLKTGQAIVSIRQADSCEPFLMRAPPPEKNEKHLADVELKQLIQDSSTDSHVICSPNTPNNPPQSPQEHHITPSPHHHSQEPDITTPLHRCVITDICEHLFDGTEARRKRLGLHPSQIKELTDDLVKAGLVKPVMVDSFKLFEFTPFGLDHLHSQGLRPPQTGKGGLEHAYVIRQVEGHLRSLAYKPKREQGDIDLCVPGVMAIEVETGKSNIHANIRKLTQSKHPHKFMVTTRRDVIPTIKRITDTFPDITLIHFKDFLKIQSFQS